jgi:hypothetical protein
LAVVVESTVVVGSAVAGVRPVTGPVFEATTPPEVVRARGGEPNPETDTIAPIDMMTTIIVVKPTRSRALAACGHSL